MSPTTLPVFDAEQRELAHTFLATHVAEMMGRKFEEGDWSRVYTAAKGIPLGTWSNLSIDISFGSLGVEHKMICRPAHKSILDACGTAIMHPAGTRAIRIPLEEDPTTAARDVLRQYGEIVDERTAIVRIVNDYNHGKIGRAEAITLLRAEARMTPASASSALPAKLEAVGDPDAEPDMRMGWLLWASDLAEFLYFEERMEKPRPEEFVAEWKSSGGGRRKTSRNLWVYKQSTGEKIDSITTEAGAKIQPYFTVPLPNDPNLYHFKVQGEEIEAGFVRVWLTKTTAELLQTFVGPLTPENLSAAINNARLEEVQKQEAATAFGTLAIPIIVPSEAYAKLVRILEGVSDEHTFKLFVEILSSSHD